MHCVFIGKKSQNTILYSKVEQTLILDIGNIFKTTEWKNRKEGK